MVSFLNEFDCYIIFGYTVGYWFGKGARIGLPLNHEASFLQVKRWKELRAEIMEMFFVKHFSFTFF